MVCLVCNDPGAESHQTGPGLTSNDVDCRCGAYTIYIETAAWIEKLDVTERAALKAKAPAAFAEHGSRNPGKRFPLTPQALSNIIHDAYK